jgi:hypothetical protein
LPEVYPPFQQWRVVRQAVAQVLREKQYLSH